MASDYICFFRFDISKSKTGHHETRGEIAIAQSIREIFRLKAT